MKLFAQTYYLLQFIICLICLSILCFDSRGAVTLLFQQFEVAFRQYVFPLGLRMPDVNPAVIYVGVGRIAVVEIRQTESGGRYIGRAVS